MKRIPSRETVMEVKARHEVLEAARKMKAYAKQLHEEHKLFVDALYYLRLGKEGQMWYPETREYLHRLYFGN